MHTNICSLEGNFDKLELLLHSLDYNFAVLALTEIWHVEGNKTFAQRHLGIIQSMKVSLDHQKVEDDDSMLTKSLLT